MSDWIIYTSDGRRTQRRLPDPGYRPDRNAARDYIGFAGSHTNWKPQWFAARMARGWRLFELDEGWHDFVRESEIAHWWRAASPDQRRFPSLAALEMWIRHAGVRT